ncbi:hypothetical protein HK104_002246 [Borealophlyctis nickersoniae]|nr:hypothetical protein HK104_002246 [Borealophlyctis nickersoniae]
MRSHVAVVYDSSTHQKLFYADGNLLTSYQCTANDTFAIEGGSYIIGSTYQDTPPSDFQGEMDEIRMWSVARTQAQIQASMYRTITSAAELNQMIFYYNMDNYDPSDANLLKDASPNGFDIGLASTIRWSPKHIVSTAPVHGAEFTKSLIRATSAWNGSYEIPLVESPDAATELTITITSFPTCLGSGIQVTRKDGMPLTSASASFPASVPLVVTAPAPSDTTPDEDTCVLTYTASDGTTTSSPLIMKFYVRTNRPPIAGNGGGAMFCDGQSYAVNTDFKFDTPYVGDYVGYFVLLILSLFRKQITNLFTKNASQKTIEWWSYHFDEGDVTLGTIYSIGDNEIGVPGEDNWCLTQTTRWNTSDFCIGRFLFHQQASAGTVEAYNSWNFMDYSGYASVDMRQYFEVWKHIAVVSTNETLSIYVKPFWGNAHWYKGFVDEFRVFNYSRSSSQIRSDMHTTLKGDETGLIGYWNFDQYADTVYFDQNYTVSTLIQDSTANKYALTPGGCVPNKPPTCKLGTGLCKEDEVPKRDCYDKDGTTQIESARPTLYYSNAPIGGYIPPLLVEAGGNATVTLTGIDNDGDAVVFSVIQIPDTARGSFSTSDGTFLKNGDNITSDTVLTFVTADAMMGGHPAAILEYRVYDTYESSARIAKMEIHVKCPPGTSLDPSLNRCTLCPRGSYKLKSGFETTCDRYSNFLWTSAEGVVVALLAAIGLAFAAAMMGYILANGQSKVIRSASPSFCLLIIAGCVLGLMDVFTYVDLPSSVGCALQPLLVALAFTISIGNLVMKTYRIHVIFNHAMAAQRLQWMLTNKFLATVSGSAVAIDLIIIAAWYGTDRPRPLVLEDINGQLYCKWGCESLNHNTSNSASIALIVYNALWLAAGTYFAYKVRNVKSAYNESQHIIPCIYILLLCSIFLLPMNFATDLFTFKVRSLFVCFVLFICPTFVIAQLFVPKMLAIIATGEGGPHTEKSTVITGMRNTMGALSAAAAAAVTRTDAEPDVGGYTVSDPTGVVESDTGTRKDMDVQVFQGDHFGITLVQASTGFLSGYEAYTLYMIAGAKAIILKKVSTTYMSSINPVTHHNLSTLPPTKKYRQSPCQYYTYFPSSVTATDDLVITLKTTDAESIKIKFHTKETRDLWVVALKSAGGTKSGGGSGGH